MNQTAKRIEYLRLLKAVQHPDERPGETILRALGALLVQPNVDRVAQYIASNFLGADCDDRALMHAKALLGDGANCAKDKDAIIERQGLMISELHGRIEAMTDRTNAPKI